DHHVVGLADLDPRHDHRLPHRVADRDRLDALDLHGLPQTTFSCRSCAIAFASSPSSPARISSVCSPSSGGALRTEQAVSENLKWIPSIHKAPAVGCSTVSIMARAAVCGSSSASATELILAQGTPTALSLASQPSALSCASACSIRPSMRARFSTRARLLAKRSSFAHSG